MLAAPLPRSVSHSLQCSMRMMSQTALIWRQWLRAGALPEADEMFQKLWAVLQGCATASTPPGGFLDLYDIQIEAWPGSETAPSSVSGSMGFRVRSATGVFIRPCWPALWGQMRDAAAAGGGTPKRLALAGTAGTGRRMFLLYALWRLAQDGAFAIVLQTSADERVAFCRGQAVYEGGGEAFAALLEVPGTWLLGHTSDGEVHSTGAAHILMVTAKHRLSHSKVRISHLTSLIPQHCCGLSHVARQRLSRARRMLSKCQQSQLHILH